MTMLTDWLWATRYILECGAALLGLPATTAVALAGTLALSPDAFAQGQDIAQAHSLKEI